MASEALDEFVILGNMQDDQREALAAALGADSSEGQHEAASSSDPDAQAEEFKQLNADDQLRELRDMRDSLELAQQEMKQQIAAMSKATRESRAERILFKKDRIAPPPEPKPAKRERAEIIKPTWASTNPETTAQKKLKASISGCLDRSICTTQQKRSALFDALNNHRKM